MHPVAFSLLGIGVILPVVRQYSLRLWEWHVAPPRPASIRRRDSRSLALGLRNGSALRHSPAMLRFVRLLAGTVRAVLKARAELALENLALRQQLAVLAGKRPRPRVAMADRVFWVLLRRFWSRWAGVVRRKNSVRGHAVPSVRVGVQRAAGAIRSMTPLLRFLLDLNRHPRRAAGHFRRPG